MGSRAQVAGVEFALGDRGRFRPVAQSARDHGGHDLGGIAVEVGAAVPHLVHAKLAVDDGTVVVQEALGPAAGKVAGVRPSPPEYR